MIQTAFVNTIGSPPSSESSTGQVSILKIKTTSFVTLKISLGENGEPNYREEREDDVILHPSFAGVEGVFEGHDEVVTETKVEGEGQKLEESNEELV